jgi:O-antigen/teichoic acid export membrane protein
MLIIAVPVFLIIVIFPNFILSIFDPNFSGSTFALLILAFAQLVNVATGPVLFLMNMIGREKELMIIIIITSILTIVLGLILVPKYSYHGAAISTAIGLITQNIIAVYKSKKYIKIMNN